MGNEDVVLELSFSGLVVASADFGPHHYLKHTVSCLSACLPGCLVARVPPYFKDALAFGLGSLVSCSSFL